MATNIVEEKIKFQNYLKYSQRILLINHRRMDGDAFGSLSGFYHLLKKIGKYEVKCLNEETTPPVFQFLSNEEIFEPNLDIKAFAPDLIIGFDIAAKEQLGNLYEKNIETFLSTTFVLIDHHISNPGFGNINIIDTEASSTCEMVFELIRDFGFIDYMDSDIATFLLTGIITDTNSFFNTNSTAKCFQIAGDIMTYHPRHQYIVLNLFKRKPYNRLKLWGQILESLKNIESGKIVWNIVPESLFIQTATNDKDISGFLDEFLTTIDQLEVGFLLYEVENGKVKGSFRSKVDSIDLSLFCSKWGGGGHARASGFLVEGKNIFELEQEVIQGLREYMKK